MLVWRFKIDEVLEIVAFYHCKYLFRIKMKMMVETSKLLSMRTEFPVVTVTLWLDNVIFLLRVEPEDRFLVCDQLVVLEQGDRLHVLAVDLAKLLRFVCLKHNMIKSTFHPLSTQTSCTFLVHV